MERFAIQAEIWTGDGQRTEGHLVIEGGRISAVDPGPYRGSLPVTRLDNMSVSSGMIDLMVQTEVFVYPGVAYSSAGAARSEM